VRASPIDADADPDPKVVLKLGLFGDRFAAA
jgi:hypothetical protein